MEELISIIVPVYNAEKYLGKCIQSLLSQNYTNIELVLVDDGSTDSSGILCDNYAESDSRIIVIHKQNGGVSSARNIGLETATGKYVTFVDSDDYVSNNYISSLYNNLIRNKTDLSFCKFAFLYNDIDYREESDLPSLIDLSQNFTLISFANRFFNSKEYIPSSACRILYKKSIITDLKFNKDIRIGEDWMFILNAIFRSKRISSVNEPLYFYRSNENSATHSYYKDYLNNVINIKYELEKLFANLTGSFNLLSTYNALLCYHAVTNELKGSKKDYRKKIKEIRESDLYPYFKFTQVFSICGLKKKIKYILIWILVKFRLV